MEYETYKTSDLALATTLSLYFPIEEIERIDSKRVQVVFERVTKLDQTISDYWKGSLVVEPHRFFDQLKVIKTRIYSVI